MEGSRSATPKRYSKVAPNALQAADVDSLRQSPSVNATVMPLNPRDCLPTALRGPDTRITSLGPRASGSRVFAVDADGQQLVLKISGEDEPLEEWRRKRALQ